MKNKLAPLFILFIIFTTGCSVVDKVTVETPSPLYITPTHVPTLEATQTITPVPTIFPQASPTVEYPLIDDPDLCRVKIEEFSVSILDARNYSYAEIAEKLFEKRLNCYLLYQSQSVHKIDAYQIVEVSPQSADKFPLWVGITYSVKPAHRINSFNAGNGVFNEENGWMEYKFTCLQLVKSETEYHLTRGGTGC